MKAVILHFSQTGNTKKIAEAIYMGLQKVIGWNDWFGGNENPTVEGPYYTDGHPDKIDLLEAKEFGKKIADKYNNIVIGNDSLKPKLPQGEEYKKRYGSLDIISDIKADSNKSAIHSTFKFDRDKCETSNCSLCKGHCPTKSIDPGRKRPICEETCEHCHYCELICPSGAIVFTNKLSINKNNPSTNILIKDLMEHKELRRFRQLIDFELVGTVKPTVETLSKHPYIKVSNINIRN